MCLSCNRPTLATIVGKKLSTVVGEIYKRKVLKLSTMVGDILKYPNLLINFMVASNFIGAV